MGAHIARADAAFKPEAGTAGNENGRRWAGRSGIELARNQVVRSDRTPGGWGAEKTEAAVEPDRLRQRRKYWLVTVFVQGRKSGKTVELLSFEVLEMAGFSPCRGHILG
jgi:hypothetical protein